MHMLKASTLFAATLILAACGQSQQSSNAMPGTKVGKPYVIEGKTYYPSYDPGYDRTGQASWYGPGFHGKRTANGEVYDQNDLTAAHPTLPMPSMVRVTNIENGKSLLVRVNDRGPFKRNRIIDLSRGSAQKLGIHSLAQVRVQFLPEETQEYMASVDRAGGKVIKMAQFNSERETKTRQYAQVTATTPVSSQIVESTVSTSHTGEPINDAAPVLTVKSGELSTEPAITTADIAAPVKLSLVNEAHAEEPVPAPAEPATASSEPAPYIMGVQQPPPMQAPTLTAPSVQINANETITETEAAPPPTPAESKPASGGNGRYVIIAGSFASEENAYKLLAKLSKISKTIVDKIEIGDKTWWRVRVGPYASAEEANAELEKVRSYHVPDAKVVRR